MDFSPTSSAAISRRGPLFADFVFSLPFVMMKFLSLGMTHRSGGRGVHVDSRAQIGMEGKVGTLAPGAFADVAIFRREKKQPTS